MWQTRPQTCCSSPIPWSRAQCPTSGRTGACCTCSFSGIQCCKCLYQPLRSLHAYSDLDTLSGDCVYLRWNVCPGIEVLQCQIGEAAETIACRAGGQPPWLWTSWGRRGLLAGWETPLEWVRTGRFQFPRSGPTSPGLQQLLAGASNTLLLAICHKHQESCMHACFTVAFVHHAEQDKSCTSINSINKHYSSL